MTCPTCTAPAGRIRTVAEDDVWRHYYACLRVGAGHKFSTVEEVADKSRTDRLHARRMLAQAKALIERVGEVVE